ncbi:MAG: DUF2088 domain-containing protein [Fibrobacteria bacterium]
MSKDFPRLPGMKIRQSFPSRKIPDLPEAVRKELSGLDLRLKPGARIAIGIGSRGIANLTTLAKELITFLTDKGARPFVVPAMGSHGGATAEGQAEILAGLGITEAALGVPIVSSMEVTEIPAPGLCHKLYMGRNAFESDGVVLLNRIKPHTDFHGTYESGLVKMSVVGLGNHEQAKIMHGLGVGGLRDLIPLAAKEIFATGKILFGLAVVEDAHDDTMRVRALKPGAILAEEPELLRLAVASMPKLPADRIDILIVDTMGKNLSGTGMDTNIIGRIRVKGAPEPESPSIGAIIVDDLSPESHGNALGIGLADITTRKLFDKIDFKAMYANVVTTTFLERGKTPIVADTLAHAFEIALRTAGGRTLDQLRVIRIGNTLHLEEMSVSPALYREMAGQVELVSELEDILKPAPNPA